MYAGTSHRPEPATSPRNSASEVQARLTSAPTSSGNVLRRASRACYNCRLRKVKCDLSLTGGPCRNCRQDEVECVTTESRRSRKYRLKTRQLKATDSAHADHGSSSPNKASPHARVYFSPGRERSAAEVIQNPAFPEHPPPIATGLLSANAESSHEYINLPPGVGRPRQDFDPEDYQTLVARGALKVPHAALRDELLLSFVLYVHPYWPVLDLQDLLDAVYLETDFSQCSLLLYQAVMFAGSAFVDMRLLERSGFTSRRSARKALFDKVKVSCTQHWYPT